MTQLNNHFKLLRAAKTNYEELEKSDHWPIKWQMKSNIGASVVKKKPNNWLHLITKGLDGQE